jgi:predicted nucleic acid-binding protein
MALDANILVYAVDNKAGLRGDTAAKLVANLLRRQHAVLPLQVLGEFYNVLTRRLKVPPDKAYEFVAIWQSSATVVAYDSADLAAAHQAHRDHGLPFWDALIWAVCERAGVDVLATEDFQNGRKLGRVRFVDPFTPANAGLLGLS